MAETFARAWSRRRWIGTLAAATGATALAPARGQSPSSGSVMQFGADPSGTKDSTPAFTEAIKQFDVVQIPAGTFLVHNVPLRSGLTLAGRGETSILRTRAGPGFALLGDSGSADLAGNLRGLVVRDLQLRGSCDTDGFEEHEHLASVNGATDVTFQSVVFRGFRGDGLYLGSGWNSPKAERHNRNVLVRGCTFDGINHQNRNGISVIDCDRLTVEKCSFLHLTRDGMPGSIDIEPNHNPFHVIRDIHITDNTFLDAGGTAIGFTAFTRPTAPARNILIENNAIDGVRSLAFGFVQFYPATPQDQPAPITVRNNRVQGKFDRPFWLRGVVGVELQGNRFEGAALAGQIGDAKGSARNVLLRDNVFRNCGSTSGAAVSVTTVEDVRFIGNEFIDSGNGDARSAAVAFEPGNSQRVSFDANRFSSTRGKAQLAIAQQGHRFAASTNQFGADNVLGSGLGNEFEARGLRAR